MTENVKNDGEKTTYTFTSKDFINKEGKQLDPFDVFEQFFGEKKKKEEVNLKAGESTSTHIYIFIFTYIFPVIPFFKISEQILKKLGFKGFFLNFIIITFVLAPFILYGGIAVSGLINKGWRFSVNPVVGIFVLLLSLLASINVQLTHVLIWITLITVYMLGFYQQFIKKS